MSAEIPAAAIGAKAAFAIAGVVLAIVAVYALERVGAPDRLVTALGPLLGLFGIAALGVTSRAKTLFDFLVARRATPPQYAGLALTAPIGGFALVFASSSVETTALPWRGVIVGLVAAAFIVSPWLRARQASALSDVLVTRFPSVFTRMVFALLIVVCGAAVAAAGLGYAALTIGGAFGIGSNVATILCAATLMASLTPGGFRSLIWTDAASGAVGLLIMLVFVGLSAHAAPERLEESVRSLSQVSGAPFLQEVAAGATVASLFAFANPALAVASPAAARRAGLTALLVLAGGGAAAGALGNIPLRSPSESALASLVACLPALALARAGAYAGARAFGLNLFQASKRLSVLASRRMAMVRYGVVASATIAAVVARQSPNPSAPLYFGLSLWLAFGAPSVVLAALPGRTARPSIAAFTASVLAALVGRHFGFGNAAGPDLLVGSLGAALAGVAVGLCVFIVAPAEARAPRIADPFVDMPDNDLAADGSFRSNEPVFAK